MNAELKIVKKYKNFKPLIERKKVYFEINDTAITSPFCDVVFGDYIKGNILKYWLGMGVEKSIATKGIAQAQKILDNFVAKQT